MVFDAVCSKGTYQVNEDKFNNNDYRYSCRCCIHVRIGTTIICVLQILFGLAELIYSIILLSNMAIDQKPVVPAVPFVVVFRLVFPLLAILAGALAIIGIYKIKPSLLIPQMVFLVFAIAALFAELVWTGWTYPHYMAPFVVFVCLLYVVGIVGFLWFIYVFIQCRCYLIDLINVGSYQSVQRYQPV